MGGDVGELKSAEGWYLDPSARHGERYWTGDEWSERVSDEAIESTDPLPPVGEASGTMTATSSPHRIGAAVVCLRISAVLYVLVGLLFFPLMTAGFDDLSPFALISAFGMFAFCLVLVVLIEKLVKGLQERKVWAWAAGLGVFGIYLPSGYFLLGAIGVWALLQKGTRAEFGQS